MSWGVTLLVTLALFYFVIHVVPTLNLTPTLISCNAFYVYANLRIILLGKPRDKDED